MIKGSIRPFSLLLELSSYRAIIGTSGRRFIWCRPGGQGPPRVRFGFLVRRRGEARQAWGTAATTWGVAAWLPGQLNVTLIEAKTVRGCAEAICVLVHVISVSVVQRRMGAWELHGKGPCCFSIALPTPHRAFGSFRSRQVLGIAAAGCLINPAAGARQL